jgi:curli biogenesis system outer membrane secretion channel CsgG
MTHKLLLASVAVVMLAVAPGCFNAATVQQMQQMNESYSISPNFDLTRTWRVAVLPPTLSIGNASGLYDHAGMMLMRSGRIALVDRGEVDRILSEQQFANSGLVDPATAARLGKLMGAEAVMVAKVTSVKHDDFFTDSPEQRNAQLTVKIISVETAEVLYYSEGVGSSFEGADEALSAGMDVALAPLIRKGNGQ